MEIQEENMMGSNDLSYIAKGKRTKRQRPQSPIVLAMTTTTTTSSSSSGGGGSGGGNNEHHHQQQQQQAAPYSPTSSTGFTESTEEEEDMANCLILLAKGHGSEKPRRIEEMGNAVNGERFTSRRFTEAETSNGKGGFYVYECKTCNRCFPSFQALGGHRASHKKPKNMVGGSEQDHQKMKSLPLVLSSSSPSEHEHNHQTTILPIQISRSSIGNSINNNKSKVHECSICGSEFSSGQALGGHMRRHRTTNTAAAAAATSTTIPATTTITNNQVPVSSTDESDNHRQAEPIKKTRNLLSLDLNLPAPSEDDHRGAAEGKFSFGSKQSHLVFSASALVDCHY